MNENTKAELLSRMDAINLNIDECMTFEQMQYFLKGYEYCMYNMRVVINDTYERASRDKCISEMMEARD